MNSPNTQAPNMSMSDHNDASNPANSAEASVEQSASGREAVFVPHQDFKSGLPHGRFRVIVNPQKAKKFVKHRLFIIGVAAPMVGIGIALSLWSYIWIGLPLIIAGMLLHRFVQAFAPKILLHLALNDAKIYQEAIDFEIMEVRYAG